MSLHVSPRPHPFYLFMGMFVAPFLRWPARTRVRGRENIPREGGFVLASNHISNLDPYVAGYLFFPRRQLRFMAKMELFRGVLKPMLYAAGAFPVRRGEADAEAFKTAVRLAKAGEIVVMFPMGTRARTAAARGIELKPHTGAARIALAARVPLVPVAVAGTDRLRRLGPVRVAIGPPDSMEDLRGLPAREAARQATERLMGTIERLRATL